MSARGDLPTGIVTFVFTDIEGSTRLLRRFGDRYAELLDRHLELMAQAWDTHHGHPIDSAGDGVFVAFQDPTAAVAACAEAQRQLCREPWPVDGEVRARIGLHSGLAAPHAGAYRALAVHQAARVMSAAHGGQVLLSAASVVRLSRLDDVSVLPLGRFRVRDFDEPVQLFELSGHGLPTEFPAVRALPADGHNLVPPPTSFRGRDQEVHDVIAELVPGGLVTLTGPGGVGKTRLATEIGMQVADHWPDGAWLVDLAPIDDPALIPVAVGSAVGAPSRGGDRWTEVLDHLHERQALLIFDNCERLAGACGVALDKLLAACPACGALATSRVPLSVHREQVWRIGPLDLPGRDLPATRASAGPAVELFLDRVAAVRRDVALDEATVPTIVEICRKLDGLPLALELAAARLAALSPDEVLQGLSDRFRLLRSHNPTIPERQRTLEALLEWSDRLLDDRERACLRRMAVLGSSFSIGAATAAAASREVPAYDVPELVWSLVDKSLVAADLTANATRYRLLESVRDFARRRLDDHGETESTAVLIARRVHALAGAVDLINLSFGGYAMERMHVLAAAVRRAKAAGTVVVASAGNDATSRPTYPAALRDVVGVGAVGPDGPAPFTNYGPWVRACAPGVDMVSWFFSRFEGPEVASPGSVDPDHFESWARWSGTSFAAPVVVAALARAMLNRAVNAPEAVRLVIDGPRLLKIPDLGTVVNLS